MKLGSTSVILIPATTLSFQVEYPKPLTFGMMRSGLVVYWFLRKLKLYFLGTKINQMKNCTNIWVQKRPNKKLYLYLGTKTNQIKNCSYIWVRNQANKKLCFQ